ncbi:MAG: sigma-70 family RNA polymerase sigma factor [Myxococcota bacterium]
MKLFDDLRTKEKDKIANYMVSVEIYRENDEATLIEKARGGDERAFKELYERNFERIYLLIARVSGGEIEIEDAVQEVFMIAYRRLGDFERRSLFSTWLCGIAFNVARSHRNRNLFNFSRNDPNPIEDLPLQSLTPNPQEFMEARAAEQKVRRILKKMPEKKRKVLVMFELEGLSGAEIAEILKCPVATVWTRLHYAREHFAKLLKQEELIESKFSVKNEV